MNEKKCIIYCRVSTAEQSESGYSLQSQEKLLREYAEKNSFKVSKIYSVSESASGQKQRQMFDEMLDILIKKQIKKIVVEKVDRLTRNLKDAVKINEWIGGDEEREVHFAKENWILNKDSKSNEKFIWNIRVSTSQYYTDNLSEEVKKGQKEKIRQGWLPTKPPIGYKTVGEKGHKIHVIEETSALFVKRLFDLYATGNYSLKKLQEEISKEGMLSRRGNLMPISRLASILAYPFYIGKIRWNGEIYEGNHDPLIDKTLFEKVQTILKGKATPKYGKHLYLFKGLISCGECGGSVTWEKHKGHLYGHCNHYRNCNQSTWSKEYEIEDQIIDILSKLRIKNSRLFEWIKKALKESHKDKIDYYSNSVDELKKRHDLIEKRLDKLYEDRLDEKISEDFYERKFKQYTEEKSDILGSINRHSNADAKYFELGISFFELAQKGAEIYTSLKENVERKQKLLRLIFKSLNVNEGKITHEFTEAFNLIAEAVKTTNGSKVEKLTSSAQNIFEPSNFVLDKQKNRASDSVCSVLLRGWDSNPRPRD
jgi:site-specific DNA recombinase